MPNRWVEHVKEFARKNNISYGCALSDPNLKKGYIPIGDKRRKPEKLEMAVPDTSVKPKGIVIKPHEVIPLQQAFPPMGQAMAKKIDIKPRPLAATLGEFDLLRKLLLRQGGLASAMVVQKGLVKAKKNWIDGSLSPNSVLVVLEITNTQSGFLDADGDFARKGVYISVATTEINKKEINDLLNAIGGKEDGIEFYHTGGAGSSKSFRMKLRGDGIKQKRAILANISKWLEQVPSVAAVKELYDKEFKEERGKLATSEETARKDSRLSGATEWLGHPLSEIDYKDVVRSFKALIKKHKFKYNGIQTLLKETDGNSAELISRVYKTLAGASNRSVWDPILEDFKKSLLAKGFWVENVKRLPADVGAYIGSFLNLPKGVTKELIARRTGKGYKGGGKEKKPAKKAERAAQPSLFDLVREEMRNPTRAPPTMAQRVAAWEASKPRTGRRFYPELGTEETITMNPEVYLEWLSRDPRPPPPRPARRVMTQEEQDADTIPLMDESTASTQPYGKGYGGAIRLPEDPLYAPPPKDRTLPPTTLRNEDWIYIYDQAMGEPTQADYERVVEMANQYYGGDWNEFSRGLGRWIIDSYISQQGELPPVASEAGQQLARMVSLARREFNFLRNAALAAVPAVGAGMVRARSSLVQGNPHAMWGGVGGHDEPKTPPWIHGPPQLTPMTETRWTAVREIIPPPYSSQRLNELDNILQTSFGNSRVAMRDALLNYLLDSFGGEELEEDDEDLMNEELEDLDAAFEALDEV